MVFNSVFNSISLISRRPVYLSMVSWSSFNQYFAQYFFQDTGCFHTVWRRCTNNVLAGKWLKSVSEQGSENIAQKCNCFASLLNAPVSIGREHIVLGRSVRPSVRLSGKELLHWHIFLLVRVRAFIFHMSIYVSCVKTFLLVPSSRSSFKVKVEYQGQK